MADVEKIKVLIADNSRDLTALLKVTLEEGDICTVDVVHDGERAYQMIAASAPDLLITDLILPGLDGMSLLRQLKDEGRLPCTIILSAFWNDRHAFAARLLGVGECLEKPCRPEVLRRKVCELCGGAERSAEPDPAVRQALAAFGIPVHLSGYAYLAEGISRILRDRSCLQGITKSLYRDIAKVFGVNPASVERAMRTAICRGWERLDGNMRRERFGPVFDGYDKAPSNLLFLGAMAEHIEYFAYEGAMSR